MFLFKYNAEVNAMLIARLGFFIMKTLYKAYIDRSSFSWGHFNS